MFPCIATVDVVSFVKIMLVFVNVLLFILLLSLMIITALVVLLFELVLLVYYTVCGSVDMLSVINNIDMLSSPAVIFCHRFSADE